jgi:ACS family glucarate transporter-like MFS transporter
MIGLTFMVAAVAYLDRSNIAIAAPLLKEELGLSNVELGVVFSAFSLGYAATQPIAGRLADRFGAYRIIALGVVIWSVLTAVTASIPAGFGFAFLALLGVRFALGVSEAVIFPASNRMVANWMPPSERGLAIGLVALVLWLLMARETPAAHPWASAAERDYIKSVIPDSSSASTGTARWTMIISNPTVQLLIFSYFCFGYAAYIFFTWFFTYLSTVRGLDLKSSGIYGTLPFIAMAVASPAGGWIADRLTVSRGGRVGRCGVASAGMVLAAVFIAAATQVEDVRVVAAVLALGSGALYLAQSAFWTLSADIGRRSAGAVSGVMNMGSQIGGAAVAMLTPLLADTLGWSVSFLFTAGVCLAGGVAWLWIDPDASLAPGTAN